MVDKNMQIIKFFIISKERKFCVCFLIPPFLWNGLKLSPRIQYVTFFPSNLSLYESAERFLIEKLLGKRGKFLNEKLGNRVANGGVYEYLAGLAGLLENCVPNDGAAGRLIAKTSWYFFDNFFFFLQLESVSSTRISWEHVKFILCLAVNSGV